MATREPKRVLQGGESSAYISRLITTALLALSAIVMFSLWLMLTNGATGENVLLLVGALLSGLVLFAYSALVFADTRRKSWLLASLAFSGFIPYLFGTYLVFYRGVWSLRPLLSSFSFAVLVEGLFFLITGYAIVLAIYHMTELSRAVKEGEILIK